MADDLTIDEMMADPLIRALMRADRQDPREVGVILRSAAHRIKAAARQRMPGTHHQGPPASGWVERVRRCGTALHC